MSNSLDPIRLKRLSGTERFFHCSGAIGCDLLSFWQWSCSDLVSNTNRGRLAEFIVARAVGLGLEDVRREWDAVDLVTPSGIKLEVKSAAYLQSWHQERPSSIVFSVQAHRAWDSATNQLAPSAARPAHVYVFALLHHKNKLTLNPLNLSQWSFFVLPVSVINTRKRSQYSITLASLQRLCEPVDYSALAASIYAAAAENAGPVLQAVLADSPLHDVDA